jgi:hypothetical protein
MFGLYLSHLQALKKQIPTVNEQCIVGSPMLTIYRVNNNENMYVAVLMVYNIYSIYGIIVYVIVYSIHNSIWYTVID